MLKLTSLFSGIGAYEEALNQLGIPFELINYCELDKQKSKAYAAMFNEPETKNLWDVTKIDGSQLADFDMMTYSFPCQSFSQAGNRRGTADSRGLLFYDALAIIKAKQPKVALAENVGSLATNFKDDFDLMLQSLEDAGYNNYWQIIDARDFSAVARKRVYIVSIRKDVDVQAFTFPVGTQQALRWYDVLNLDETREPTPRQLRLIDDFMQGRSDKLEGKIPLPTPDEYIIFQARESGLRVVRVDKHPTLTAGFGKGGGNFSVLWHDNQMGGISARQCLQLMGFADSSIDRLEANRISKSTQYFSAGDSVSVYVLKPLLQAIFKTIDPATIASIKE